MTSPSSHDVTRSRAVDWKFVALDVDSGGQLDRKELKTLRQLVNKLVKPRPCAKTFYGRCDTDTDASLSRQEWASCFSNDAIITDGTRFFTHIYLFTYCIFPEHFSINPLRANCSYFINRLFADDFYLILSELSLLE